MEPRSSPAARSTTTRCRPSCARCRRLRAELGDDLPVAWRHRSERYTEKLATPDTSVGDLVGDVDPVKVAQGRTLGDPETVHYGLVPRTNRGIFGLNELPDLAERIQVALFNVLEERDIQIRGYSLRLPLDLLLVATANPEDYTNRGRIITPLKDRFGAEIRTHYQIEVDDEVALIAPGGRRSSPRCPSTSLEVVARFTRGLRESSAVDQRSGVSARFAIAAAEGVAASALRRAARVGEAEAVARICDVPTVVPTLLGKVEFEMGEEGRERDVLDHLLRVAVAETFRARLAGLDLSGFTDLFAEGAVVETGELVPAADLLAQVGTVPGLSKVLDRLGHGDDADPGSGRRRRRVRPGGAAPDPPASTRTPSPAAPSTAPSRPMAASRRAVPSHGRFRYGPWHGGPDPLAPPFDVRAALDEVGRDVLAGGSPARGAARPAAPRAGRAPRARRPRRPASAGCADAARRRG